MPSTNKPVVKSADRVLDVLEAIAQGGRPLSHTQLCADLSIPKSSMSQLLGNLVEREWLRFDPGANVYDLGPRLSMISDRRRQALSLPELAQPLCDRITRLTGESSSLNLRWNDLTQRVCGANSDHPLKFSMNLGETAPMYAVSSGKVMLAWLTDAELADYLGRIPLEAITRRTITSEAALRRQLKDVRRSGVAASIEEYTPGIVGLSVPVLDGDDRLVGALNVALPKVRDGAKQRALIVSTLAEAAEALHRSLAAAGGPPT